MGGPVEMMLAAERLAPALPHEPVLACGIHAAALIAAAARSEQAERLLTAIAAGEAIAVVAHQEAEQRYSLDRVATAAQRLPSGDWQLDGTKCLVPSAQDADVFIVSARDAGGEIRLFAVARDRPGLSVVQRGRIDGLPAGDLKLAGCVVEPAAALDADPAQDALAAAADRAEAAEIAAMVGIMDACIKATVEHVRTRRQFGAPIGTFQALQHRIADMWIACEETRSLAFAAALACGGSAAERRRAVSLAKVRACDAAQLVGAETIQLHGGSGMTDELIVSHWYRRLLALRSSFGDRRHHIARLAETAAS